MKMLFYLDFCRFFIALENSPKIRKIPHIESREVNQKYQKKVYHNFRQNRRKLFSRQNFHGSGPNSKSLVPKFRNQQSQSKQYFQAWKELNVFPVVTIYYRQQNSSKKNGQPNRKNLENQSSKRSKRWKIFTFRICSKLKERINQQKGFW